MKLFFGVLFFIVSSVPSYSYALDKLTIKCNAENLNCPPLPLPPAVPIPPAPPELPAIPMTPMTPMPPAPPALPVVPEIVVPAQAHLACVGKALGTEITWEYENKSTMTGVCGERDGKPYLKLNHVHISSKVFNQIFN